MSLDATTASSMARQQPQQSSDFPHKASLAFCSLVLSALFNLFFLFFTLINATALCMLLYQVSTATPSLSDQFLLAAIVVSLLVDLLYFSLRLHNRATSPHSRITYAAYFREKPASLLRLWGVSSHHRRLFYRWQAALRFMLPLDLFAVVVCVVPVHAASSPAMLYQKEPVHNMVDMYHQALTMLSTMLELVVAMECVLEVCRRCCGPRYPQVLVWHPQTGSLSSIHPHEYQQALLQQQQTQPDHAAAARVSPPRFVPSDEHPVHPPPAYGHQDIEDAYSMPPGPHVPHPYMQPYPHPHAHPQHHQQPQWQQQPYYQPQPYKTPPKQQSRQRSQQPQLHAQPYHDEAHDEEQVEGRMREAKLDDERAEGQMEGTAAAQEDEEDEEGDGQGGELGAVTAPLVMMISPELDDDVASRPRVMMRARASDADRLEEHNPRPQPLSPPRYAVVHMSST